MRRFAAALLVAAFAVPLPQSAHAGGCPMVSDPTGDAKGFVSGVDFPVSDPAMDITYINLLTDATKLKVVVGFDQYTAFDSYAPGGRMVDVAISAKGATAKHVKIHIDPTGTVTSSPLPAAAGGPKMEANKTVWVAVPLTSLGFQTMRPSRLKKVGDKYTALSVSVYRYANQAQAPATVAADTAASAPGWFYVHRAKGC